MASGRETIDGYVADSLYPSAYHGVFSPPWTDAILRQGCIAPPRTLRGAFTMADLGCGDGIGLIVNAAAHPEARFIGIDASPAHIARGQALIAELGLTNIELHCALFQNAGALLANESVDYIAAQGILAWVGAESQAALLDLAAAALKPGGVLTIGYNCCPGWLRLVPFQKLLLICAKRLPGGPTDRFNAALETIREAGAIEAGVWEWIDDQLSRLPRNYFAHEYLNQNWAPFWASDVLGRMHARGMEFIGEARSSRLRADLALKAKWRALLGNIDDPGERENALDLVTGNWFRTDIYMKTPVGRLDQAEAERRQLACYWAATAGLTDLEYEGKTTAGTIRFDNAAARAIMAALQSGPAPLSSVPDIGDGDLLNTIDALFMAGLVVPADAPAEPPDAAKVNAVLRALGEGDDAINGWVGANGAVQIKRAEAAAIAPDFHVRMGIPMPG